jgi:hypothetical protein
MDVQGAEIAFSPGFRWGTSLLPGHDHARMADGHDGHHLPLRHADRDDGEMIKTVLEDVADNLFNPDPYYQQGGDMVRVGGLTYTCDPLAGDGQAHHRHAPERQAHRARQAYKVAGWAPVAEEAARPATSMVWDVVEQWLKEGNSYLFGGNAPYVEEMYENYLANPGSVPDNWRDYFDALQHVPAVDGSNAKDVPHLPVVNALPSAPSKAAPGGGGQRRRFRNGPQAHSRAAAHCRLPQRRRPLGRPGPAQAHRAPQDSRAGASFYGFSEPTMEIVFNTSNTYFGKPRP